MEANNNHPNPLVEYVKTFRPMEPMAGTESFNNDKYFYQVKWDGVRILAFITRDGVFLRNRKGRDKTNQYPELYALKDFFPYDVECLLDGEAVVMKDNRPSFSRIIQRDFCRRNEKIKMMTRILPVTYCIFDILYLDGEDIFHLPYAHRQDILKELPFTGNVFYVNENFSDGEALYQQIINNNLEGVVAKEKNSPYLPGRKSRRWLKIKPRRRQLAVLGGVILKNGLPTSMLLGAYGEESLIFIGRAGSGLTNTDVKELKNAVGSLSSCSSPFVNTPVIEGVVWLTPIITVEIEFAEWTDNLQMRAPVIKGFSTLPQEEAIL